MNVFGSCPWTTSIADKIRMDWPSWPLDTPRWPALQPPLFVTFSLHLSSIGEGCLSLLIVLLTWFRSMDGLPFFWTPDNLCVNYGKCYRTGPDLFLLLPIGFCDTMTGQPLLVRKMNTTGSCGACRSNWCLLGHVIPNRLVTILCCLRYFASEYRDGDDETFLCQAWHASGAQALHSQSASARKPRQIGWVPWRSLHVAKQFDRCPHLWHQWPRGIFAVYPRCPPDSVDLFFWGPTGDLHMALGQVVVAAFLLQGLCGLGPIGRCLGSRWAERWRKCTIEGRWGFQHWTVVGQLYCNCGPSMVYLM